MIEQLDDIVEDLANQVGVYGAHPERELASFERCNCRVCWTSGIKARLHAAVEVELKLEA